MKQLIIMRGLPGSGKTTFVNKHFPASIVCSADHFFERNGAYQWDATRLFEAHQECQAKCLFAMQDNEPLIVIDNTNIKEQHYAPYVNWASQYGYQVVMVTMFESVEVCAKRNVHNVPINTLQRMAVDLVAA